MVLCQGCPSFTRGFEKIRWTRDDSKLAMWLDKNLLLVQQRSVPGTSRWLTVEGWKNVQSVKEAHQPRVLDGTVHFGLNLTIADSVEIWMSSGILVSSPTTPRQLAQTLNLAVIDWHANLWSNIVGHQIAAPEFSVRFCRRRNCPNAA